jgi:uncharacterized membrane protein
MRERLTRSRAAWQGIRLLSRRRPIACPAVGEGKLKAWEAAGLIDGETAARIRAWEAEHTRPLGLWAVFGLAALAIGLGVLSVVAANWDEIPGEMRLTIHFALMTGIAGWLWIKGDRAAERHPWLHEAVLFVFGMLGMTFMGHIGQVYQTSSPLWQPLALWLALFAPLLLLRGSSWLTAAAVVIVLVFTGWNYAIDLSESRAEDFAETLAVIRMAAAVAAAVLLAGLGAGMRSRSARKGLWIRLEQLALAYGVGLASLVIIASAFDRLPDDPDAVRIFLGLATGALLGAISAALVWRARRDRSGEAEAGVLLAASLSVLLAFVLSDSTTAAGVLFMVLWAGIAAAALLAGWRGVFQLAVGVIAIRLIVLSFELASDLLLSGVGLIVSGFLILGVAFAAVRVSKRFAPDSGETA